MKENKDATHRQRHDTKIELLKGKISELEDKLKKEAEVKLKMNEITKKPGANANVEEKDNGRKTSRRL